MSKIPRTFCVTLKETPLRTKGFTEISHAAGLEFTPFYGVLGSRLGLTPKFPNEIEAPGQDIFMNEGALGCNLSHFLLWNMLKHQPENEFLVFEDDAVFDPDFKDVFQKVYDRLPSDWQIAYVGWVPYGKDGPPMVIEEGISIRTPSATHAYLVRKNVLEELCNIMLPFQSNIDLTIIQRLLPRIRYYVFEPSLVGQRSYLNTKNSVWTSLVYDWQHDLYGCRKQLLSELRLEDGWYALEKDDKSAWRWSKDTFEFQVPVNVDSITLECSTPIENKLVCLAGEVQSEFDLKAGGNKLSIQTGGASSLKGRLTTQFVPANHEEGSTDTRVLGICLRNVTLDMGAITLPLGIGEIASSTPPPMSFKLL